MAQPRIEIWFELETRCNLHCKFCYNFWKDGSAQAPSRLSTAETIEALRRLFDAVDCQQMAISGGEPLLREDLYEILAFVRSRSVPMVLTTNSTLLSPTKIVELVNLGVTTFQVPLHSLNREVHDYLCGLACWEQTLRNLISLRSMGQNVVPVFVATACNLQDFPGVMKVCSCLGLDEIIFNRFVPTGLGRIYENTIGVPDDSSLIRALLQANEIALGLNMWVHLGTPITVSGEIRSRLNRIVLASCPVGLGQSRWLIDANGNIRRCNQSSLSIGNLLTDGLRILLQELDKPRSTNSGADQIKPCKILSDGQLLQLGDNPVHAPRSE
jgi:MoaA/NifB/PqqE/SkfB family radical SAM enzyme